MVVIFSGESAALHPERRRHDVAEMLRCAGRDRDEDERLIGRRRQRQHHVGLGARVVEEIDVRFPATLFDADDAADDRHEHAHVCGASAASAAAAAEEQENRCEQRAPCRSWDEARSSHVSREVRPDAAAVPRP